MKKERKQSVLLESDSFLTQIMGYDIYFPKKPFAPQLAVMSKSLMALTRGQNALLESPTGTGKTLALLTSSLCWQKKEFAELKMKAESSSIASANESTSSDSSMAHDDGSSLNPTSAEQPLNTESFAQGTNTSSKHFPRIYFCTRTHSQLQQIVEELRNCSPEYTTDLKMTILASRKHLCINSEMREKVNNSKSKSLEEECKDKNKLGGCHCRYADVVNTKKVYNALCDSKNETHMWDIEDAVYLGNKHKGCPYYAARAGLVAPVEAAPVDGIAGSQIIFAPYSYLLEPGIRNTLKLDLNNAVVIFDEAHNIEDICRHSLSITITLLDLMAVRKMLTTLKERFKTAEYTELLEFVNGIFGWLNKSDEILFASSGSNYSYSTPQKHNRDNVWLGSEALLEFQDSFGLTAETLGVYALHFDAVLAQNKEIDLTVAMLDSAQVPSDTYEEDKNVGKLSSLAIKVIGGLFGVFTCMLKNNKKDADDFKMVVERKSPMFDQGDADANGSKKPFRKVGMETTMSIWCFNSAIAFRDLDTQCRSILLTSGTLSPLDAFSSELGTLFPVCVEAPHVINVQKQIWVGAVSNCQNSSLDATYMNQQSVEYQNAVGVTMKSVSRLTPGGVLMFLPSYGLLNKLQQRWKQSGLLEELAADVEQTAGNAGNSISGADVYFEPKENDLLAPMLKTYYSSIDNGRRAVLVAVCRGKVSEGINFADNYARAVIILGIPFPSLQDLYVSLKREYQDNKISINATNPASSGDSAPLSGSEWYKQQGFRAVNQAIGRCIRHMNDYGAILLCDPRYAQPGTQKQLSRWLRTSVKSFENFDDCVLPLFGFYAERPQSKLFMDKSKARQKSSTEDVASSDEDVVKVETSESKRPNKKKRRSSANSTESTSDMPGKSAPVMKPLQRYFTPVSKGEHMDQSCTDSLEPTLPTNVSVNSVVGVEVISKLPTDILSKKRKGPFGNAAEVNANEKDGLNNCNEFGGVVESKTFKEDPKTSEESELHEGQLSTTDVTTSTGWAAVQDITDACAADRSPHVISLPLAFASDGDFYDFDEDTARISDVFYEPVEPLSSAAPVVESAGEGECTSHSKVISLCSPAAPSASNACDASTRAVPDSAFWSIRMTLKNSLTRMVLCWLNQCAVVNATVTDRPPDPLLSTCNLEIPSKLSYLQELFQRTTVEVMRCGSSGSHVISSGNIYGYRIDKSFDDWLAPGQMEGYTGVGYNKRSIRFFGSDFWISETWHSKDEVVYQTLSSADMSGALTGSFVIGVKVIAANAASMEYLEQLWIHEAVVDMAVAN